MHQIQTAILAVIRDEFKANVKRGLPIRAGRQHTVFDLPT